MSREEPVALEELRGFTARALEACGLDREDAGRAAEALCHADAVGMDTHGVVNLPRIYAPRLRSGEIDARATPEVVSERGGAATLDGHDGLGLLVGSVAMDEAVARAARHGVGAVAVRGSSHMGSAGYYAGRAVRAGMIGLATTNLGSQRIVRPPGGLEPMLGTNPISVAAPAGALPPFLLDMSTSVVSTGQVRAAQRRGEPIPEGWIVDDDGRPVTDPFAYDEGTAHLLWLGGAPATGAYKGYGLGLLVDVLAGALSGARVGPSSEPGDGGVDRDVGHFFLALDVGAFRPPAEFAAAMDAMLGALRACPAAGDEEVAYAGFHEARVAERRGSEGVPLEPEVRAALDRLAADLDVEPLRAPVPAGAERGAGG